MFARRRRAAARGERRRRHLRRHAERPVHERLLLPLRLLRVLEGEAGREPARRAVPRAARGDRAPRRRGVGARRDRDLPAGRDPSRRSTATTTPRSCARSRTPCRICTSTRSARSRSGRARRRSACRSTSLPRAAARRGARVAAGDGGRGPRRRDPRGHLPGQDHDRAVARGARDGASRPACARTSTIMFGHVDGPRNWARHLLAVRELQQRDRRVHRVRAAPVRAHGGADLPEGRRAPRADVRRGAADARRRPARAPPVVRERAGLVGEGRAAGARRGAARRRQRPRRDADERVDLARGRRGVRARSCRRSRWRR